jgi:hypothetical protein
MKLYRYAALTNVHNIGLSIHEAGTRLHHLCFVERRLMLFCVAQLVQTPSRDLKLLFGRAQYLAAQRCTALRERLRELRMPKARIETCPSAALALALDEALYCSSDEEITQVSLSLHSGLIDCYRRHLEQTNSLADAPTCDLIKSHLPLLSEITDALRDLIAASQELKPAGSDDLSSVALAKSAARVQRFIAAAGGLDGSQPAADPPLTPERATVPFKISRESGRPAQTEVVWDYIKPPIEDSADYFVHMLGIRFSEINVAEGVAIVMYETPDMPWEFYYDLSRHLWDEVRHAIMGEAAIESIYGDRGAIPMREYERVYCMEAMPLEQYATLGIEIEGGQMRYPVGKRGEWEFCRDVAKHPLMTTFQDFDWADEVLHVNLAKKQLTNWFPGGVAELSTFAHEGGIKRAEVKKRREPIRLSHLVSERAVSDNLSQPPARSSEPDY